MATGDEGEAWLLLIHQIPPQPSYLRVKVWRRLQAIGAVALKNSVYVLPDTEPSREHFEWLAREIAKEGGEASLCRGSFVEGLRDEQVRALFAAARNAAYHAIAEEARRLAAALPGKRSAPADRRAKLEAQLARLERRLSEVASIDFFASSGREVAEGLLRALAARLGGDGRRTRRTATGARAAGELAGHVWVTRRDVHIDRIATAWLILRFVDPTARFEFVSARGYRPKRNELRFDMFDGEFTHEGDRCTFEVLCERLGLDDPALRRVGEIVHDSDLRDAKFGAPETAGVERLVSGLAARHRDDPTRIEKGAELFDDLYASFRGRRRQG